MGDDLRTERELSLDFLRVTRRRGDAGSDGYGADARARGDWRG
jgi:hypothetical protein